MSSSQLQINPGGKLAIQDVIGRDQHIARYWRVLARQSLVLSAERRIGKTHIVMKMHEEAREGFVTFYQDLEKVHSILELVRFLYDTVNDRLPKLKRARNKALTLWSKIVPERLGEIALLTAKDNWKGMVEGAIEDVLQVFEEEQATVVFLWDEFPLMLYNLARDEGTQTAIQLLDLLRSLRQSNSSRLRFVFTGSIGLHLVLAEFRRAGNANDAINDMQKEEVPPLSAADSHELSTRLLASLRTTPDQSEVMAERIFELVGGFPYYIHHVVDRLDLYDRRVGPDDVDMAVNELIYGDQDPANMSWYAERIPRYYDAPSAKLAFAILDVLSRDEKPASKATLSNLIRHYSPEVCDEAVSDVCATLRRDHYLTVIPGEQGLTLGFRWPLVKRWWSANR